VKVSYKHLAKHIHPKPSINEISEKLFQLGHEHEIENEIFNLELTPNRGDCLSVNGLIRDLSVFFDIKLNQKYYHDCIENLSLDFTNNTKGKCMNISFLKIEIQECPHAYKGELDDYFKDLNLNKNNFFTDVSNYISYETGQPTHCYEALKIKKEFSLEVIDEEAKFQTLLDTEINLKGKNLVFKLDDKIINLAGVVGDKSTSCSNETKSVLIECAYFNPEDIIGKSVAYDIKSEAAHKFERGVDPTCHERILRRFLKVVEDHAEIKKVELFAESYDAFKPVKIKPDISKINSILGLQLKIDDIENKLTKLGFLKNKNFFEVPSFRNDIKNQNDLAEEIARIIGFNNITPSKIIIPKQIKKNETNIENKLKSLLIDHGFNEIINNPFVKAYSDESIKVDNPLDSNRKYLRTSLKGSMIDSLTYNERRQQDSIKLFEISDVYFLSGQKKRLIAIIASGRIGKNYQDFSNKIDNKYLTKIIGEFIDQDKINIETISRDKMNTKKSNHISYLEIETSLFSSNIVDYQQIYKTPKSYQIYKPISEFPSSSRDLSFSIKDFDACKLLEDTVLSFSHKFIKDIFIFDYYKNENIKEIKIAFRFIFQSNKGTLKEQEINDVITIIIKQALSIKTVQIPGLKIDY